MLLQKADQSVLNVFWDNKPKATPWFTNNKIYTKNENILNIVRTCMGALVFLSSCRDFVKA